MNSAGSFRRYLFAGDAGIAQATQVPSMANAGDGKTLTVQSNVSAYNCWQEVVLDDNVYEVYRAEVLPAQNTWTISDYVTIPATNFIPSYGSSLTHYQGTTNFTFELNGMTNMKRIFLEYAWSLYAVHKPRMQSTTPANLKEAFYRHGLGDFKISDIVQPEFMMLDAMSRVVFKIGKNKLTFESGAMEMMTSRKVHMANLNYTPAEREQVAQLGLLYAKNLTNFGRIQYTYPAHTFYPTNPTSSDYPYAGNFNDPSLNSQWPNPTLYKGESFDAYKHIFDNFFEYTQSKYTTSNYMGNAANYAALLDGNCNITLPLFCIVPFLAQTDSYLPKGVPIDITIYWDYYAGDRILERNWIYALVLTTKTSVEDPTAFSASYRDTMRNQFGIFANTYAGISDQPSTFAAPWVMCQHPYNKISIKDTVRLIYDYFVLKENLQKEFNLTWIRKPLLYNYFYWERFDTMDRMNQVSNGVISYNLMINQQRPLALLLRFENPTPLKLGLTWQNNSNISRACATPILQGYQCLKRAPNGTDEYRMINGMPAYNYFTGSCAGNAINFVEVYVGSQLVYKADTKDSSGLRHQSVHATIDTINPNYKDTPFGVAYASKNIQQHIIHDNATSYKIDLSQNKAYERGHFSLDRGNTNLSVTVKTVQPLNTTDYTLALYAMYPVQMTIDKSYEACETKWPVIIAQNGPIVEPQYNIN